MNGQKQYSTNQLKAGDTFVVRGFTSYAKLTHVIDGEELKEAAKRAAQYGRPVIDKPHTTVTLTDAVVEYANPSQPTLAELYAQERLFQNKEGKICYQVLRTSPTLADYGVVNPQNVNEVTGIYLDPDKQVDNGIPVRCFFRAYETKPGMNNGISVDTIIFLEPVRYYEFSNTASNMAARGLTWNPPAGPAPAYNPAAQAPVSNMPEQNAAYHQTPAYGQPPMPQNPMNAPQPAYQQTPAYGQQPVPQNQMNAPQPAYQAPQQSDPYGGNAPQTSYGTQPQTAYQMPQQAQPNPMNAQQQPQQQPQPQTYQAQQQMQAPVYQAPQPQPAAQTIGNTNDAGSAFGGAHQY